MAYEDFTSYTEVDPDGRITVDSASKVSWVNLRTRLITSYLYKDKGVGYFSGDFTHKFEIQDNNVGNRQYTGHWALANSINDIYGVISANEDGYFFSQYDDSLIFYFRIIENGSLTVSDYWVDNLEGVTYYVEIVRDDDGGANSTGQLTAYIRTGSHTGALQDTLVVDCSAGEQNDFRYIYPISSYDDNGDVGDCDGFTQNLDIGEAVGAAPTGVFYGPLVGPLGGPI